MKNPPPSPVLYLPSFLLEVANVTCFLNILPVHPLRILQVYSIQLFPGLSTLDYFYGLYAVLDEDLIPLYLHTTNPFSLLLIVFSFLLATFIMLNNTVFVSLFSTAPPSMWTLNSPTRDLTCAPCSGSAGS